jgi:hypothetical protein
VGDLLFKAMDMPYSEEISERLKKMMPPQLQEQPEGGESPEVQQVKQQAQQIIEQLTQQLQAAEQAMQEADQEAQQLVVQAENAQGKAEIDAAKVALDNKKLELEDRKLEIEERKLELEGYKAQSERLGMQNEHMETLQSMPEYQDIQNTNSQAIQQLLMLLAQQQAQAQQPKNKLIEIVAPSGKVYTGQVSE